MQARQFIIEALVQTAPEEPAAAPAPIVKNSTLDMAKAFKKGWDQGVNPGQSAAELKDPSGRVPLDLLQELNKLPAAQRVELYNLLIKLNP